MIQEKRKYKKSTIIFEGAPVKKSSKDSHYVDNEKFYAAMVERRAQVDYAIANGLPKPRVSEYIGECFWKIATKLSTKHYFSRYPFREDMIMDAVEAMLRYVDSFDTNKTKNPFSYMTQTAYYSFIDTIRHEKRELAEKFRATLAAVANQEIFALDDPDLSVLLAEEVLPDVSYMSDYVKDYEKSLEKKKKAKETKIEDSPLQEFYEDNYDYGHSYGCEEQQQVFSEISDGTVA